MNLTATTTYLNRPEGRLGFDILGDGPLLVLVPGMGDLRAAYRFLTPSLREAGYRVACTDLRGHGDSDSTFKTYGDVETASDVVALIEKLGGPAVVIGNSMGAGSAALAGAQRPDLVVGLVLLGPFVRNPKVGAMQRFDGMVTGGPRRWLRIEGATVLVGSLVAHWATRQPWWLVPLTLLVPDVLMVGYLGGTRLGARLYNVAHSAPLPAIMVGLGWWQAEPLVLALGLVCQARDLPVVGRRDTAWVTSASQTEQLVLVCARNRPS